MLEIRHALDKGRPEEVALQLPPLGLAAVSQALFVSGLTTVFPNCSAATGGRPAGHIPPQQAGGQGQRRDIPHSQLTPSPAPAPLPSCVPHPSGPQTLESNRKQLSSYSQASVLISHLSVLVSCQRPGDSHTRLLLVPRSILLPHRHGPLLKRPPP